MKLEYMNGWKEMRYCWPRWWAMRFDKTPEWVSVSWLGFVVFICR